MTVVDERLGHDLVARAEAAKIAVAGGGRSTDRARSTSRPGSRASSTRARRPRALDADLDRIVAAARETVAPGRARAGAVDALYLTGGSTGLDVLSERLRARLSRRARSCAATASPASRPAWRCSRSAASAAGRRLTGPVSRASTAAIAARGRVDVAAVQPGDAHPPGAHARRRANSSRRRSTCAATARCS